MNKLQKIFNKVAKHLLKQNAKSAVIVLGESKCAYRGYNGLKCAAGRLVSDKEYDPEQENKAWYATKWSDKYTNDENDLILNLQHVHDECCVKDWKSELVRVAIHHGLKLIPELK